ncbi:MAG: tyrosine-type recombinase/integrase [Clostridiales bacterium]|nr:tyrosine-type recombinase/integrase [Clostridiales bacterium]
MNRGIIKITEKTVEDFKRKLREEDRSEATIDKYGAALEKMRIWLGGEEVTRQKLYEYRDYLLLTHCAGTVNGVLSAINTWMKLSGLEGRMKLLKVQKKTFCSVKKELSREEYNRLIKAARRTGNERLLLVMETICSTGIRVSELRYITIEAVENGRAEISLKGKNRTILLPGKLCRKLQKYARKRKIRFGEIFLTRKGTVISRKQIWAEMKALCKAAEVDPAKVFPHNLRHLFARCFYKATRDVAKLADVLGHSSINTTRIYLLTSGMEHIRMLENLKLVS